MRRATKRVLLLTVVIATVPLSGASAGDRGPTSATVEAVGGFEVEINESFTNTFRFDREKVKIRSGGTVTWKNKTGFDEAHTITIATGASLPSTIDEIFNCGAPGTACAPAIGHVDADFNPIPGMEVLNAGLPGLNEVGDSLLLAPGGEISAVVSAPAGTRLQYLCAIHPWMQGEIKVKG